MVRSINNKCNVCFILLRVYTDKMVVFGGHIDSWDVGVGAMDDGGGCIVAWQVYMYFAVKYLCSIFMFVHP